MSFRRTVSYLIRSPISLRLTASIDDVVENIYLRKLLQFFLIPIGVLNLLRLSLFKKKSANFEYNLSLVVIIKNEAPYIKEWIRYHSSVGVQHFYIYDNDSDDDVGRVLEEFESLVTVVKIQGPVRQIDAYNDAIRRFKFKTKYMGMIDADEFIFRVDGDHQLVPLIDMLLSNREYGGLVVNWALFGSSGYEARPKGLVTSNFIYRAHDEFGKNRLVKTICNPRKVFYFYVSHAANYLPGYFAVNEDLKKVDGPETKVPSLNRIRLNHYYSKSKSEFIKKRARGSGEVLGLRNMSEFDEHDKNDVYDDSLKKYNEEHGL